MTGPSSAGRAIVRRPVRGRPQVLLELLPGDAARLVVQRGVPVVRVPDGEVELPGALTPAPVAEGRIRRRHYPTAVLRELRHVATELAEGQKPEDVQMRGGPGEGVRVPERVHVEDVGRGGRVRLVGDAEDDVHEEVVRDDGGVQVGHGGKVQSRMTDHPLHYVSEYDILDRIAARFGLDFTVDENLGRVDERDEYGSRSSRDATGAEIQMWRLLVPDELRRVCDNIWVQHGDGKKVMALPATPEEVYSNTLYHEITYVSAEDAVALLGLPCFEPNLDRQTLLDGLIGSVHGEWKVYVSRQVPQGYCHDRGKGEGRGGPRSCTRSGRRGSEEW